jgi:thiaminase/transcriptional activator TenA
MKLSQRLKKDAEHIWNRIYDHPFVREVFEGVLPEQKFRFYILQDYNYLVSSIKNFSLLASRAGDGKVMRELVDIAYIESTGEFEGYKNFLEKMGLTIEQAEDQEMIPAGISYVSFLLSTSSVRSFEEGIAAVLPCYWSYHEIARFHKDKLDNNRNDLYREWASYYLEEGYIALVNRIKNLVDGIRNDFPYDKLKLAFVTSSKYEYMFWDSVYGSESTVRGNNEL